MYTVVPGTVGSPVAIPVPQQFVTRLSSLVGCRWVQAPVTHIDLEGWELILDVLLT